MNESYTSIIFFSLSFSLFLSLPLSHCLQKGMFSFFLSFSLFFPPEMNNGGGGGGGGGGGLTGVGRRRSAPLMDFYLIFFSFYFFFCVPERSDSGCAGLISICATFNPN